MDDPSFYDKLARLKQRVGEGIPDNILEYFLKKVEKVILCQSMLSLLRVKVILTSVLLYWTRTGCHRPLTFQTPFLRREASTSLSLSTRIWTSPDHTHSITRRDLTNRRVDQIWAGQCILEPRPVISGLTDIILHQILVDLRPTTNRLLTVGQIILSSLQKTLESLKGCRSVCRIWAGQWVGLVERPTESAMAWEILILIRRVLPVPSIILDILVSLLIIFIIF